VSELLPSVSQISPGPDPQLSPIPRCPQGLSRRSLLANCWIGSLPRSSC